MSPDVIAAGVFGIAGAVVGAVVGLFGERLLQRMGEVQCMIEEDGWRVERGRGGAVEERRLRVAFLNSKEVPVTLWDVSVEFSKGGEPWRSGHARTWISSIRMDLSARLV